MNQHFNQEEVLQRLGNDQELLKELLSFSLEDIPEYLANIDAAIDAGDTDQIRKAAHKMKGFARNMAFTRLAELALAMEQGAAASANEQKELFEGLKEEADEVCRLIKD